MVEVLWSDTKVVAGFPAAAIPFEDMMSFGGI